MTVAYTFHEKNYNSTVIEFIMISIETAHISVYIQEYLQQLLKCNAKTILGDEFTPSLLIDILHSVTG